jgi:hypothetical protein
MKSLFRLALVLLLSGAVCAALPVFAHEPALVVAAAESTTGPADLKFREMFKLPVGAKGLEPSAKLLRLDGRLVRMVGYMVDQETARSFILAPVPLSLGDEDESLADDLPPGVVFVHAAAGEGLDLKHRPGLLELTGVLSIGGLAEPDGRVSTVRLTLAPTHSKEIVRHVPE